MIDGKRASEKFGLEQGFKSGNSLSLFKFDKEESQMFLVVNEDITKYLLSSIIQRTLVLAYTEIWSTRQIV